MHVHATSRQLARTLPILLVLILAAPTAAAPISWNAAQDVAAATDIQISGTLVEAFNATASGLSPTVNGVSFLATDALLDNSFNGDTLEGGSSGDPILDQLIGSFDYGNGTSTAITVGGGLLVPGDDYLIQVFFTDLRGCCNGRDMTFGDGLGNDVDLNATGAGLGQYAVGTFQADGTSQNLSLAANGFSNAHINGYQIRAVPEPGTGVLLLCGLAWMAQVRRATRVSR